MLNKEFKIFLPVLTILIVGVLYFLSYSYSPKWNFNWKGIRPEIKDSIKSLDEYGEITSNAVGYSGRTPNQWHRQHWILKNANKEEFLKLIEYPSGTVKAIAYEGLLRDEKFDHKFDLITKSLNDTLTFVHYSFSCGGTAFMLSDYVINFIGNINNELPPTNIKDYPKLNLSKKQLASINNTFRMRKEKLDYYKKEYLKTIK